MKINTKELNTSQISQEGVTLLISILVMASIVLVSLGIATFAVQELRASRSTLLSEPAIGAAESGAEEGLWAVKRQTSTQPSNCPTETLGTGLSQGIANNSCIGHDSATVNIRANQDYVFYLYDPQGMNTDTSLLDYPYAWLSVQEQIGVSSVSINATRLDGAVTGLSPTTDTALTGSPARVMNISPMSSYADEGRIRVVLNSVNDATVMLNTDVGMPNLPTIASLGCSTKTGAISDCNSSNAELFSRKIIITVPQ